LSPLLDVAGVVEEPPAPLPEPWQAVSKAMIAVEARRVARFAVRDRRVRSIAPPFLVGLEAGYSNSTMSIS